MMGSLEQLREDLWGENYSRTKRKATRKKSKPVGFYKDEKGTTRPITKGKGKKVSRIVTRYVFDKDVDIIKGAHGYEMEFPSSSKPGVTYTTTYWTEDYRQFKEGDIT